MFLLKKYTYWAISAAMVLPLLTPVNRTATPPQALHSGLSNPPWGFFAHKRINRLAVLTLPPEMMVFYKKNIDFVTDHAVDPDMRRYSTKQEGARHYIDLDNYGTPPFDALPRQWVDAMVQYTDIWVVNTAGDTVQLFGTREKMSEQVVKNYKKWYFKHVLPQFYQDDATLQPDSLYAFLLENNVAQERPVAAYYQERLSQHGILPWNLQRFQRNLTEAFRQHDAPKILRLSAEIGHYIGDAHVPLHTCSNYNGQKTNQHGIHGFWESRIPELFADESYDYFVGKPEYVPKTETWFWQTAFDSNAMVDSVLTLERALRNNFPTDRQMCPDTRLGILGIYPCREFAAAYQDAMNDMVERRMRAAIHAVSSAWYTAWVDAGQPDLSNTTVGTPSQAEIEEEAILKKTFELGKILGRGEDH
jgi:hypothetical protein